eukprot:TRINITY_DN5138_c0_g1_i2.p1 TRINITY_DN5138_c0_g1~~TRINITY_DN5138_c0_g1_i2.p1  ORF type:complete len:151 (-),score=35.50 TRINITY_DN5138_c0_g1_i2:118-570(-)
MNSSKFVRVLQTNLRGVQRRYNSGIAGWPKYKPLPPPPPGPLYPVHPNWLIYISGGLFYGLHVLNNDAEKRKRVEEEGKFINIKAALDIVLPLVAKTEVAISSGFEVLDTQRKGITNEVSSSVTGFKENISGLGNKVLSGVLGQIKAIFK